MSTVLLQAQLFRFYIFRNIYLNNVGGTFFIACETALFKWWHIFYDTRKQLVRLLIASYHGAFVTVSKVYTPPRVTCNPVFPHRKNRTTANIIAHRRLRLHTDAHPRDLRRRWRPRHFEGRHLDFGWYKQFVVLSSYTRQRCTKHANKA